ncbi:sodium-translocating pyrophosphatase [Planctomycetota bacterium]
MAEKISWIVPGFGVLALLYALYKAHAVRLKEEGTEEMIVIGGHIREGAMAFLRREYTSLAVFAAAVAIFLAVFNASYIRLQAVSFVCGALTSALAGYFGMRVATAANVRTANAARTGLNQALRVAFDGGTVMGMSVVGLAALGVSALFLLWGHVLPGIDMKNQEHLTLTILPVLTGFSLGASSIALFARVGGGIYTKAADVGADLVGKVEAGIPEDDPRNPATIADNVGDNVGDVAGMGADLFESYVGSMLGAMILGATAVTEVADGSFSLVVLPLALAAVGILMSIIGTFFVRTKEGGDPQKALNTGTFLAAGLVLVGTYLVVPWLVKGPFTLGGVEYGPSGIFWAVVVGLAGGVGIGLLTEYYTSESRKPVQKIADASQTGAATNLIAGIANGMRSTAFPVIVLAVAVVAAYKCAGLYGVAIAAVGMLSTTGIQLAVDAYGPIADNAGGITEMSGLGEDVRARTDKLDAVGNTTAAIGKGFAIGSAALTALALFSAFTVNAGIVGGIEVSDPLIMAGLLIGAMMPFLFSSYAMEAVGSAAFDMIEEVRRQFREIPGLMEGKAKADFARCVDISTSAALKRMVLPGLLAVLVPAIFGFLNVKMLGGLLVGVTASGVMLAIFQSNAGGSWDNAKKLIEGGAYGGKGSDSHKAAVVGDTVGDPFKDTSGPSLNILIKLMSVVSVTLAPMFKGVNLLDRLLK